MNQSEIEANCTYKPAPSAGKTIDFGFVPHWLRKGASFVNQSQSVVKQNQSKREITFDTLLHTVATPPSNNSSPFLDVALRKKSRYVNDLLLSVD